MAHINLIFTYVIVLTLFSCNGILSVEGRKLRPTPKEANHPMHEEKETTRHASPALNRGHHAANQHPLTDPPVTIKKDLSPPIMKSSHSRVSDSLAAYEDGFKPTTPGSSPGVGHSSAGKKDNIGERTQATSPGVQHTLMAANIDDYRQVTGHSPGVGHSFGNKITERNP